LTADRGLVAAELTAGERTRSFTLCREFDAAEEICRFAGPPLTSAVSRRL